MIKITVAQTTVKDIRGTSATSQKPYHLRIQSAYAHTVDKDGNPPPYPERMEILLDGDSLPYAKGDYTLSSASIRVDKNGRLVISPRLVSLKSA